MTFISPSRHFIQQQARHFAKKIIIRNIFFIPQGLWSDTNHHHDMPGRYQIALSTPIRTLRVVLVAIGTDLFTRKIKQR
jgi:hypothetical protein